MGALESAFVALTISTVDSLQVQFSQKKCFQIILKDLLKLSSLNVDIVFLEGKTSFFLKMLPKS